MTVGPRVSVVTIFRDEERFLPEAIESVRAQTFQDWELLLVDDGSVDRSADMARAHAVDDPGRIRVLRHEGGAGRGTGASRQLGLATARGELVAFLDADDVWLPERLERDVALLDQWSDAAMVYGPTVIWNGDALDGTPSAPPRGAGGGAEEPGGAPGGRHRLRRTGVAGNALYEPPTLLETILRGHGESPATCGALVRRKIAEAVGGFDERFDGLYEDQAFFAKVLLEHGAYVRAEPLDRYRQHPGSICHRAERAGTYDPDGPSAAERRFLEWLEEYLEERPSTEPGERIRTLVRRRLWLYRHPSIQALRTRVRALRDGLGHAVDRLIAAAYDAGRAVLPRRLRRWLWDHGIRP